MKNMAKLIGIIALVAVVVFAMAACDNGGGSKPKQSPPPVAKIVGIIDIPDENAAYANNLVMLVANLTDMYDANTPKTTAIAWGSVSEGELWSALLVPYNNIEADNNGKPQPAWTGTGDFYVGLMQTDDWNTFVAFLYAPDGTPAKVKFDKENTILSFNDFEEQTL